MKFYNVKSGKKVEISEAKCTKRKIERKVNGKKLTRYLVSAVDKDGTKVNVFVTEEKYKALKCKTA